MYNIVADVFFLVGLVMKLLEHLLEEDEHDTRLIDMSGLAASGRILWGAAFSLAIFKTIKVIMAFFSIFVLFSGNVFGFCHGHLLQLLRPNAIFPPQKKEKM